MARSNTRPNKIRRAWLLCLALLVSTCRAEQLHGTVVSITDGDTIVVLDQAKIQHKIRLAGIDAPERHQAFGNESRQQLAAQVFQKAVVVDATKKDRYGRLIGKVLVNDQDACLAQVESGLAWHYKAYEREQESVDRMRYAAAEDAARKSRRGLWVDPNPIPPWEWRKAKRTRNALQPISGRQMTQPDGRAPVGAL